MRNQLQSDFDGTLKKLGEIGYTYIEGYGLEPDGMILGRTPEAFSESLQQAGLRHVSCHCSWFTPEQAPVMIEAAKALGVDYLVIPWLSQEQRADFEITASNLNQLGDMLDIAGIGFAYHNHEFEFEPLSDGRIPMEILIENTDPELVAFELDLYWVVNAGARPMDLIRKYQGRFPMFHVKDADSELEQTTVGTGIIDFENILSNKQLAGLSYYFVEDERTNDPITNLQNAYDYLQSLEV